MEGRKPEVPMLIVIMAGGTGGHVFPGLAVAAELRERGHRVAWLGTPRGLENDAVPAAGVPLERIEISGLRGKGLMALIVAPTRLLRALWQALSILRRLRPAAVLGMGGFVSGPGGIAAWMLCIPVCIHEQNAVAGLTNRLLSRLARRVMLAFPDALPASHKMRVTGNPVRRELNGLPVPEQRLQRADATLRLLVLGGSQGARRLNQTVPLALAQLKQDLVFEVRHQSGGQGYEQVTAAYADAGIDARVDPFIDDMAAAYSWADLVICRAGALTVAELTAVGLGAVLVPFPYAVDDHQTANARWLSEQGGAVLLPESELQPDSLSALLLELGSDRNHLLHMARRSRGLAEPDAAARVADICLEVACADAA
jgi:UDP-N-acetylglucosamine--N-acetylmuramyl-(pentapeptide) pyrophosphoryl-undecaprenol N-acetylglucosamine transferase